MYPLIRRHHPCCKLQLSRVQGELDELAFFFKPTKGDDGCLAGCGFNKVQASLRAGNRCIMELEIRFDLPVLIVGAVTRRSLDQLFPDRLMSLIKTSEKIDDYHLDKIMASPLVSQIPST